jgi:intracellular septation protein
MFGAILLGGLAMGRPLLPFVLDSVMSLTTEGWRKLTFRWGLFFFVLAILNEVVWRNFSTDFWVGFKVWGVMPITLAFALAQTPLILKHEFKDEAPAQGLPK